MREPAKTGTIEIARRHLADYDRRDPGTIFADPAFELTVRDAYELQFAVAGHRQQRGESVAGYKTGCVSEAVRKQLGIDRPVFGHVWASELHPNGSALPASQFADLAIEGELAVRLGPDGASVISAFPVIELHNARFRRERGAPELIANNAIHAGVVLPDGEGGASTDEIAVFRNGVRLGSAGANAFPGGPVESITHLREHLAEWGAALSPGQIILTGTVLPLYPVAAGDHIEVRASNGVTVEMRVTSR